MGMGMGERRGGQPGLRVVVVNFNGGAYLPECLRCLAAQDYPHFDVVVVDNASTDGSAALPLPDGRFRWVRLQRNAGFAAANNIGAAGCDAEWIVTLNPDAFAEPGWLAALMDGAGRFPDAAMLGCTQVDAGDPSRLDGSGDCFFAAGLPWRGNHGHPLADLPPDGEVFGPCAAAAAYRTEWFRAAGGFDERFFCYCEDVDLAFRLRLAGGRCVQLRQARVRHVGSGIAGRHSAFVHYHSARNRLWLFVKNMPGWALWALLPAHLALTCALLGWGIMRGHGGAVARGLRDGIAGLGPVLADRRRVQAGRRAGIAAVLRAMSWSPLAVLRRRPDVRTAAEGGSRH